MLRLQPSNIILRKLSYSSYGYEENEFMSFRLLYSTKNYEKPKIIVVSIRGLSLDEVEAVHSNICKFLSRCVHRKISGFIRIESEAGLINFNNEFSFQGYLKEDY